MLCVVVKQHARHVHARVRRLRLVCTQSLYLSFIARRKSRWWWRRRRARRAHTVRAHTGSVANAAVLIEISAVDALNLIVVQNAHDNSALCGRRARARFVFVTNTRRRASARCVLVRTQRLAVLVSHWHAFFANFRVKTLVLDAPLRRIGAFQVASVSNARASFRGANQGESK